MENDLQLKRMKELATRAAVRFQPQFTHFLDPTQLQTAYAAASEKGVLLAVEGGYPEAERVMAAFYQEEFPESYPFSCVEIEWNAHFGSPGHRDLLGSLMALGFERERMGDIVLCGDHAYLFVENDIAAYVTENLEKAGKVSVRCKIAQELPKMPAPEGRTVHETVSSLRLDAVLAAGLDLSRAQASELINSRHVFLNHVEMQRVDAAVAEGDVISVRGTGRIRLESIQGLTRKGRTGITIFRYAGT